MSNLQSLAHQLLALDDKISECMRCGMCQSVCPMYGASGLEGDVARGKLFLVNNLAHLLLQDPEALADKLGRCLLCGSCQAACPAGVQIMEVFRQAREVVYNYLGLNPVKKMIFRTLLANPELFNFSVRVGAPAQKLLFRKSGTEHRRSVCSPMFNAILGERHVPALDAKPLHSRAGFLDEPRGKNGPKVAFFPGCVADKMYVGLGEACIKALRYHGVAIFLPVGFACCGIPAVCSGDASGMTKELKKNLEILAKGDFDWLLTPCASCVTTIKELWPEYAARISGEAEKQARDIAEKTLDINVFMTDVLGVKAADGRPGEQKITYHDPCHLAKGLGVTKQPRAVLAANPDYEFKEMAEADRCCGCGGSFTLSHYDWSRKIGQRKRDNIIKSGAKTVATACPACMMHLENMLALNHDPVKVRHTMEIYAESLPDQENED